MVYSRRQTIEEKNNKRKALGFMLLSIGFILFMFFYGIPLLVRVANLAYDFKKTSEPIDVNDNTPPPPPRLESLPKAVNKALLAVSGNTEAGATVVIDLNGTTSETVADNDGRFSTNVKLSEGDNFLKAYSKDSASNQSPDSEMFTVTYDTEPPKLEINSPDNKSEYFGEKQKVITISGTTENNVKLQINDRLAIVNSEGNFSYNLGLNSGNNDIFIKATDPADNTTEISIQVSFTP
jgi:hypothetical protein